MGVLAISVWCCPILFYANTSRVSILSMGDVVGIRRGKSGGGGWESNGAGLRNGVKGLR